MKLPNEKFSKKQVTISSGNIAKDDSLDIPIEFAKYEKLILEICGSTMVEGTSYILEIDDSGNLVNRGVNFYNYTNDSYMCSRFLLSKWRKQYEISNETS